MPLKSSPVKRRSWDIAEKKRLIAEARQKGVAATARNHNIPYASLHMWMLQDFSGRSDTNKRLQRRLMYDKSIDAILKEWLVQKMMTNMRVSYKEIQKKALELILPCCPKFHASNSWISSFLHRHGINLKKCTHDVTVKPSNDDNGDGNIQDEKCSFNNHDQQQSTTNTAPVVSYFTVFEPSVNHNMINNQPIMEEVVVDGLVPIEEDVEIISNCDLLDCTGLSSNDNTDSVYGPNESLTSSCGASYGTTKKMSPTDESDIKPFIVTSSSLMQTKDVESHYSKPNRQKKYNQSAEIVLKEWIVQKTSVMKRSVSRKELRQKALELLSPYRPNFQASRTWIKNFLARHNITLNAILHGVEFKRTKKKNKIAASKPQQLIDHSHNNHDGISPIHDQENTSPSALQRHHNQSYIPAHTSTCHLHKIGRPRDLLKQDINWKRMVLSIPKENLNQLIISSSKASSSFRLSKSQMNTKKVSSTRKRSRKKMVLSNKIVNMTSNKDGSFKKSGSSVAKCTQCNSATQPIGQSTACEPISTNSSYVEIVGNGYGLGIDVGWAPDETKSNVKRGVLSNKKPPSSRRQKRHLPSNRRSWEISEKKEIAAEAIRNGIRATARNYDMSFSTLRVWTRQDFGDLPGNKRRMPGGGRPLGYDQSIDLALRDWVLQRMTEEEGLSFRKIKQKALEMILPYKPDFLASNGWIRRFMTRHNLSTVKVEQNALPSIKCRSPEKAVTSHGKRQKTATTATVKRKKKH